LIAEEVAKVYPELVIRDEAGRIDGVRYDELAPMLLNEVQKQQSQIDIQAAINAAQAEKFAALENQNAAQQVLLRRMQQELEQMHSALVNLKAKPERVAER
jgi:acyl-CoA reductase-like NAD-dependent aldehyde dehydrogenase